LCPLSQDARPVRDLCNGTNHKLCVHNNFDYPLECSSYSTQVSYLIFHKCEPRNPYLIFSLLIFVPATLCHFLTPFHDDPSVSFALTSASYWSLLAIFAIIYRLSPFHPLARYPGPILDRISKLRTAQICATGNMHRYRQKLHKKYGDVVRIGDFDPMVKRNVKKSHFDV
jgi:hypothetical protein